MRESKRKQNPGYQGGLKPSKTTAWEDYETKSRAGVVYKKRRQVLVDNVK